MDLVVRKPIVKTEELCKKVYDIRLAEVPDVFEKLYDSLSSEDPSFAKVNASSFICELQAIDCELFGLAWLHYMLEASKLHKLKEDLEVEIIYTKSYLKNLNLSALWDLMAVYNEAIAVAGRERTYPTANAAQIMWDGFYKDLMHKTGDPDCATRLANRFMLGSHDAWHEADASQKLTIVLANQLGFFESMNFKTAFGFESLINSMYITYLNHIDSANATPEEIKRTVHVIKGLRAFLDKKKERG